MVLHNYDGIVHKGSGSEKEGQSTDIPLGIINLTREYLEILVDYLRILKGANVLVPITEIVSLLDLDQITVVDVQSRFDSTSLAAGTVPPSIEDVQNIASLLHQLQSEMVAERIKISDMSALAQSVLQIIAGGE